MANDSSVEQLLAALIESVAELDAISSKHIAEERSQPKSVRERRHANLVRGLQATA